MHRGRMTAVYAAGHFLIDFACAFLMLRFVRGTAAWGEAVLLYNLLAFAGQAPLGLMTDRFGNGKVFAAGGCVLCAAAFLLPGAPLALAVTAGLGNALYHVGGGRDTLAVSGGRAAGLGVFVSPGALGLFLGGLLGKSGFAAAPVPILLLLAAGAVLGLCGPVAAEPVSFDLKKGAPAALAALFGVVCLRSWAGFLFAFPWKTGVWAWVFILCVVLGKTLGGILADRFGAARSSAVSLVFAAALFLLSGNALCGCLAVLLFNMTMPVTLRAAADRLPGARGFSFGLLTFALFLGFAPEYLGLAWVRAGWMYAVLALSSMALLLPCLKGRSS